MRCARIVLTLAIVVASGAHAASFQTTLLVLQDDPRLARSRTERAYLGHPGGPASDGLTLALTDARVMLEAAGATLASQTVAAPDVAAAVAAARRAEQAGQLALVTDLPPDWTVAVADAVRLPVLNVGTAADRLREQDCRAALWHLLPSERMRADALAQTLAAQRWQQVLLLAGPSALDAERAAVAQAAIRRLGLKLVERRAFKRSADPRERAQTNVALLTQGSYDVVWVVDSDGEFARGLPYRTALPRPVVGDAGLVPQAWAVGFERFGAPQLARRFARATQRPMTAHDWAAWLAGKALVGAVAAAPKGPVAAVRDTLARASIDGAKGVALSFRPWDGQLRQPLLLGDGQGVVAMAPADGVLHPQDALDTLGTDAPEQRCPARRGGGQP